MGSPVGLKPEPLSGIPRLTLNGSSAVGIQDNLYSGQGPLRGSVATMPTDFAELQRQLEEALSKLKESTDPTFRRVLLAEMRLVLQEAYRAVTLPEVPGSGGIQ